MYNLHTHSLLSDGCLLPSEVCVRYAAAGYKAIAITDHADYSNIDQVTSAILKFTSRWPEDFPLKVFPGVELTHLPLEQFKPLVKYCRQKGMKVIIAHGQTPAEPVLLGTNAAALEAGVDILAHPGRISDADVRLARNKGIFLEITSRGGHNATNAYVVKKALKFGAKLVLSHDSHCPEDIISPEKLRKTGIKAGLSASQIAVIYKDMDIFIRNISKNT